MPFDFIPVYFIAREKSLTKHGKQIKGFGDSEISVRILTRFVVCYG
jgi:hypothetical protein